MTRSRSASDTRSGCDSAREADINEQPALRATSDNVTRSSERRRRELIAGPSDERREFYLGTTPPKGRAGSLRCLRDFRLDFIEQRFADGIDHGLLRLFGLLAHALDLLWSDLVDRHALLLDLRQGFARFGARVLAFRVARLLRRVHDDALLGRREPVPPAYGGRDDPRAVDVIGYAEVLLHLIEFRRKDGVVGVFLAVDRLGFQRGEQLGEWQRDRIGAHLLEGIDEHRIGHHAQFDAVEVFHLLDRTHVVGQVAEAVLPVDQADQSLFLQCVHHLLANRTIEDVIGLLFAFEQERRIPDRHLLGDADQGRGRADHHFLRTAHQCVLHLIVRAQTGRGEGAHLELAIGRLADLFGKQLRRPALVAVFVEAVAEADHTRTDIVGSLRRGSCDGATEGGGRQGRYEKSFHAVVPLLFCGCVCNWARTVARLARPDR